MDIAILLFDRFTALDAIGPYEVLSRLPGANLTLVAPQQGLLHADTGLLTVAVSHRLSDMPRPDVIVVPGGPGQTAIMGDPAVLSWLRDAHRTSRYTASVCTGSLVLAAAGLLAGRRATSHWLFLDQLAAFGALPVRERVVVDGRLVTAAGVSAGIDMGLELAARIGGESTAQAIQLLIEYSPWPPFAAGSPATAPPSIVEFLQARREAVMHAGTADLGSLPQSAAPTVTPGSFARAAGVTIGQDLIDLHDRSSSDARPGL